ncbi:integrase arm-type DNA-binding domain-containing protein [Sinorhizobium sp. CCBAU 05631]|uniref:tyrosine-type recombinase/integrase n=1 Tax=Sinorhizobium sp. CCBAU 05631 TaxID=794846 RepID=UPI0004AF4E0F|nr:integrase arm-type DNA-binding domain-containing protein [Sinorhizobium sp. CCBAU 05631]ASY58448.1 Phage integrase [Sinorhizobium sp. CCBAU 05631]
MARHKLTDAQIKAALKSGKADKLGDGDGLWLHVQASGTASWVFIWTRHKWRREMGLGSYGGGARHVSLADARHKAEAIRCILGRGGDPFKELPERIAAVKPKTFGECADDFLAAKENTFRNDKHKAQWRMTLEVYAKPLRKIPVSDVSTDDVVRVLRPLWQDKQETASRLRGRIEKVLDYAKILKLRDGENPARWKGHLDHILGKRTKLKRGHHAAMAYADVPAFMAKLRETEGLGARALELCVLTATRSGEVLNARWSEIDFDAATWTIPAERMKAGKEHVVPLSAHALAILNALHEKQFSEFVFPGQAPRKPISNMAMTMVMRRLNASAFTVHGFRSAFRDWAGDATNFPRDVAEMALAHKVGDDTELAYRRGSALAKRRKLMDAWASYCLTEKGDAKIARLHVAGAAHG